MSVYILASLHCKNEAEQTLQFKCSQSLNIFYVPEYFLVEQFPYHPDLCGHTLFSIPIVMMIDRLPGFYWMT